MSRTVQTGVLNDRTVTPGACDICGCDDDWSVDGRGNVLCSCQACPGCDLLDAYNMHEANCPVLEENDNEGMAT